MEADSRIRTASIQKLQHWKKESEFYGPGTY